MPTRLSDLKAVEVSIVPRGANKQSFLVVKEDVGMDPKLVEVLKAAGLDAATLDKVAKAVEPILKEATKEAADKAKADAEAEAAAKLEAEKKKKTDGDPMAPVQKEDGSWDFSRIPENVRGTMQAIWKEKQDNATALTKITKQLDDERNARVTKEFVEKAATFKHLGVKTEDLGKVMKEVSDKAPEAFKALEPILKALDEKIAKGGLFSEHGTSAPGAPAPVGNQTEAEAKIEAIAKGMVEKDGKVTLTQARAQAWQQNPGLYTEHRAQTEQRRRA